MPANRSVNDSPIKLNVTDPINKLLAEYLTVNGVLDEEAYIVAASLHHYITIYRIGSSGASMDSTVGLMVNKDYNIFDSSMASIIFDFLGNSFFERYRHEIMASLRQELINSMISRSMLSQGIKEGSACSITNSFQPLITVVYCCSKSIDRAVEFGAAFRSTLIKAHYNGN